MKRIIVVCILCCMAVTAPLYAQSPPGMPHGGRDHQDKNAGRSRDITRHQGHTRHYGPQPGYSGGGNTVIIILNQDDRDEGEEIYRRNIAGR